MPTRPTPWRVKTSAPKLRKYIVWTRNFLFTPHLQKKNGKPAGICSYGKWQRSCAGGLRRKGKTGLLAQPQCWWPETGGRGFCRRGADSSPAKEWGAGRDCRSGEGGRPPIRGDKRRVNKIWVLQSRKRALARQLGGGSFGYIPRTEKKS